MDSTEQTVTQRTETKEPESAFSPVLCVICLTQPRNASLVSDVLMCMLLFYHVSFKLKTKHIILITLLLSGKSKFQSDEVKKGKLV